MLEDFLALSPQYHTFIAGIFGLMVGSFLNVVIFRYPKILFFQWTAQSYEWLNKQDYTEQEPPTLSRPPSHCYSCKTPIKAWQNIPIISYLILRGKCGKCNSPISIRYPFIELLTSLLSAYVVYRFGATLQGLFGVLLTWGLITLSFIDFDHKLLPDDIVIPTLWLGLGLSIIPVYTTPTDAIIGAICGYLFFWIIFHAYKMFTGKEAMGYGDFKLVSLLGAWFGWQFLPQIIFISTLLGSIVGISLMLTNRTEENGQIPFGPYIAIAGYCAMTWGSEINASYLKFAGLHP